MHAFRMTSLAGSAEAKAMPVDRSLPIKRSEAGRWYLVVLGLAVASVGVTNREDLNIICNPIAS